MPYIILSVRLDTAEESISELECMTKETAQIKLPGKKEMKTINFKSHGTISKMQRVCN